MDARKKAAAVSAVGLMLVAGCGGKGGGGTSLPAVPGQVNRGAQPANTSKISLAFSLGGGRVSQLWPSASQTGNARRVRYGRTTKQVARRTLATRQPKYLSPGVIGGSVSVYVFQGTNLALTQGPFSVGTTAGSDIYCYAAYGFPYVCYSNAPVFAPYGNDTFFVAMYDSQHHLLSITPGMPGTNFIASTQPTFDITPSGYPYPIEVSTYPVISTFGVDSASSCVPSGFGPYVDTALVDGGGYLFVYGPIANPITVTTSGGFSLIDLYTSATVPTPYTIYSQYVPFEWALYAASPNASGSVSISSAAGNTQINGNAGPNMNLVMVDRLAFSPSSAGLNTVGLVDASPASYACGTTYLATYDTGAPIAFSGSAIIAADDFFPGVAIVDNVSGTPVASAFNVQPGLFGFGFNTYRFQNAIPAIKESLPGANPLDIGVSGYNFGSSKIYVLNGDGSIVSIDENTGAITTVEPAASINGPVALAVQYTSPLGNDWLLSTTTSNTIYEVDNANTGPSLSTFLLSSSAGTPVSSSATSTAVSADLFDGEGNMLISGHDPVYAQNIAISCFYSCATSMEATPFGSIAQPPGTIGFETTTGTVYALFANSTQVLGFYNFFDSPPALAGTYATFGSNITSIISTYDGVWSAMAYGGAFVFNYQLGPTVYVPSLAGTRAVIVSP